MGCHLGPCQVPQWGPSVSFSTSWLCPPRMLNEWGAEPSAWEEGCVPDIIEGERAGRSREGPFCDLRIYCPSQNLPT